MTDPEVQRPAGAQETCSTSGSASGTWQPALTSAWVVPDAAKLLMAGGVSGVVAKTATAPLGRLTILYQVHALSASATCRPYSAVATLAMGQPAATAAAIPGLSIAPSSQLPLSAAVRHLVRTEGVLSLWKGNLVTVLHRLPYSAVNFSTFELLDQGLADTIQTAPARRFVAGAAAGVAGCVAAYPLDLLRTLLAARTEPFQPTSAAPGSRSKAWGVVQAAQSIVAQEGVRGLYRGLGATLAQVTPALALHFTLYSTLRDELSSRASQQQRACDDPLAPSKAQRSSLVPYLLSPSTCAAGLSAVCTSTITFPLDKIRRLIQVQAAPSSRGVERRGWLDTCRDIWRRGGPRAFYEGIAAEYIKVVPGMIVAFCTFEAMKELLGTNVDGQRPKA